MNMIDWGSGVLAQGKNPNGPTKLAVKGFTACTDLT
jgi:hypothetical protein